MEPQTNQYLDYGATTPPRPEVVEAIQEAMLHHWGNPSSLHAWGLRAAMSMEIARQQVADLLGCDPEPLVFTSGGTEANNLALLGVAGHFPTPRHMIISSVEHASVEKTASHLESLGWSVTRLPVDPEGRVDPSQLQAALRPNTALVSVVHGQNEVGTLQPIAELATLCRAAGVWFHADCVQTAGRIPLRLAEWGVDLASISGHKFYGPQGIGALYCRPGVSLQPLIKGGGQEQGLRSGTQAIALIAGMGVAAHWVAQDLEQESLRLRGLQQRLHQHLASVPNLILTGPTCLADRLPHHLSYRVENQVENPVKNQIQSNLEDPEGALTGQSLVQQMHQAGFAISSGSACSRGQLIPSRIMMAMGIFPKEALGGIRLTLGRATTIDAIDGAAEALKRILAQSILSKPD